MQQNKTQCWDYTVFDTKEELVIAKDVKELEDIVEEEENNQISSCLCLTQSEQSFSRSSKWHITDDELFENIEVLIESANTSFFHPDL
jgi:hypothetical protein